MVEGGLLLAWHVSCVFFCISITRCSFLRVFSCFSTCSIWQGVCLGAGVCGHGFVAVVPLLVQGAAL